MKFHTDRRFGVEIELSNVPRDLKDQLSYRDIACRNAEPHRSHGVWTIVPDGSLRGPNTGELVSPPLMGLRGLGAIADVVETLRSTGARVNETCGLHVHHDARDYQRGWLHQAEFWYETFMPLMIDIVGEDRVLNTYSPSRLPIQVRRDHTRRRNPDGNRYRAVNTAAFARHGTIEYRQHEPTLDAERIISWVVLTQQIHVQARKSETRLVVKRHGDPQHLQRAFWSYLGLYDKEPIDVTCRNMLLCYSKLCGWNVTKLLNARERDKPPADFLRDDEDCSCPDCRYRREHRQ